MDSINNFGKLVSSGNPKSLTDHATFGLVTYRRQPAFVSAPHSAPEATFGLLCFFSPHQHNLRLAGAKKRNRLFRRVG
jgi:hypothetical protein